MKPMEPMKPMQPMEPMKSFDGHDTEHWWPKNLGVAPNSAGGQNDLRYAYFAASHRLAVDEGNGKVTVYDTGEYEVSGVQQRQSGAAKKLVFTAGSSEVDLNTLGKVWLLTNRSHVAYSMKKNAMASSR